MRKFTRSAAGTIFGAAAILFKLLGRATPRLRRRKSKANIKKLLSTVADLRSLHPEARISVWAYDEHRIGLKPILRKIWAPKGKRPVAIGAHRFKWMYLYAFVRPDTGELVWFVFNTVNVKAFSASLAAFAKEIGAGKDHQVIIVLDNAGICSGRRCEAMRLTAMAPLRG